MIQANVGTVASTVPDKFFKLIGYPTQKQVLDFNLVPTEHVTPGVFTDIYFCLPIPLGMVTNVNQIRVTTTSHVELPTTVVEVLRWRNYAGSNLPRSAYVRSVIIKMRYNFASLSPVPLKIRFNGRTNEGNFTFDLADASALISAATFFPNEYNSSEGITEPVVTPEFPASWMCACNFKNRIAPFNPSSVKFAGIEQNWQIAEYTYPTNGGGTYADPEALPVIEQFAKSLVNDVRPHVTTPNLITYEGSGNYEPWLYDRAGFLWMVYQKTGKAKWFRHAHRATQFYRRHISATGFFDLRADDIKYSYSLCLMIDYIMTADPAIPAKVVDVVKPAMIYNPVYTYQPAPSAALWTERNAAYALMACLYAYQVTGDTQYTTKATAIFDAVYAMQQTPQNSWPATGGLWHTIYSHEGGNGGGDGNDFGMSPWMGAILIDAVFSYYLDTEDSRVLTWLSGLGDYYATTATRLGAEGESTGRTIPKYFAGPTYEFSDSQSDLSDAEHIPDVLGAVYKCLWAKQQLSQSTTALQTVADDLISELEWIMGRWIRTAQATIDNGQTFFRASPPRKPSWWFNSAADTTFLDGEVNG